MENGGFENESGGDLASLVRSEERLRGDGRARHRRQARRHGRGTHHDHGCRPPGRDRAQPVRPALEQGKTYDLTFWARADRPMEVMAVASKGSPNWDNYGLSQDVRLSTQWQAVKLTFEANRTVQDSRIQFLCGGETGQIWIDDVSLKAHGEEIFRRDFQNGIVLLNGTRNRQTVDVGEGYARLKGEQAPKYQYILDDGGKEAFTNVGRHGERSTWGRKNGTRSRPTTTPGTTAATSWPAARARQRGTSGLRGPGDLHDPGLVGGRAGREAVDEASRLRSGGRREGRRQQDAGPDPGGRPVAYDRGRRSSWTRGTNRSCGSRAPMAASWWPTRCTSSRPSGTTMARRCDK